jgi:hypothetical protein
MTSIFRDRLLFITLFVVGVAWVVASEVTIPTGYSGSHITPRSFPTVLGILLALLAVIGLVGVERKHRRERCVETIDRGALALEVWAALATFGFLILYFVALYVLGFTIATILAIAVFLVVVLKERSPVAVIAMSLGLGLGLHLLMGSLLGVYLPSGLLGLGI